MTEEDWLSATDPTPMLEFLRGKASDRKLRIIGCNCAWHILPILQVGRLSALLTASERAADGEDMTSVIGAILTEFNNDREHTGQKYTHLVGCPGIAFAAGHPPQNNLFRQAFDWLAITAAWWAVPDATVVPESWGTPLDPAWQQAWASERAWQASTFREVIGNPFHPIPLNPTWQTSTVLALAQGIYQDRAFDRLPILADALQDASCDNPDLLNHLRSEGPHTRGCWAIDLLTNRE
jgi:hypothetical protein